MKSKPIQIPEFLKKGSQIGLTATARKVSPEELEPCLNFLRKKGFKPIEGKYLYASDHQFGGTDLQRTESLQALMDHPDISAILCARGGYGTLRILPDLDFSVLKKHPKWLIGFSDITCLHAALMQEGIASVHGPMAFSFGQKRSNAETQKRLADLLKGDIQPIEYRHIPLPPIRREGIAEGTLIGGNLSLLNQLSGTPWQPDAKGKILFIEDLDEYLYHIDRMMQHLKNSGWFAGLKGLVVGHFSDMKDNPIAFGRNAYEIIADAVRDFDFPIAWHFPAGHEKENFPLIIGGKYQLSVEGQRCRLEYLHKS